MTSTPIENYRALAATPPQLLYKTGDNAEAFRRAASRLVQMQSDDYWRPEPNNRGAAK